MPAAGSRVQNVNPIQQGLGNYPHLLHALYAVKMNELGDTRVMLASPDWPGWRVLLWKPPSDTDTISSVYSRDAAHVPTRR